MGSFAKWLLDDEQRELFEFFFAGALNLVFLALCALLLWPLGQAGLALAFAKGYYVLWPVSLLATALLLKLQSLLRVDLYSHPDAFVASNLFVSGCLVVGWTAFAALALQPFLAGAPGWATVTVLYLAGLISCYVALAVVSAFYQGYIYRFINLFIGLASFAVFCLWPGARTGARWFFNLFVGE